MPGSSAARQVDPAIGGDQVKPPRYVRQPFTKEPDFGVTSVNYALQELLAKAELPQ